MKHSLGLVRNVYGTAYGSTTGTALFGYTAITGSMVRQQLAAAKAGKWVANPINAVPHGERNRTRIGATTVGQAAMKSAYWLAVLARTTRDRSLIKASQSFMALGSRSERSDKAIEDVYRSAGSFIRPRHGKAGKYVAATLGSIATQTANARQIESDQGGLLNRLIASSDTIGEKLPTPKKAKRVGTAVIASIAASAALLTYFLYIRPLRRGGE